MPTVTAVPRIDFKPVHLNSRSQALTHNSVSRMKNVGK
jgi:hypothetical protein